MEKEVKPDSGRGFRIYAWAMLGVLLTGILYAVGSCMMRDAGRKNIPAWFKYTGYYVDYTATENGYIGYIQIDGAKYYQYRYWYDGVRDYKFQELELGEVFAVVREYGDGLASFYADDSGHRFIHVENKEPFTLEQTLTVDAPMIYIREDCTREEFVAFIVEYAPKWTVESN